MFSDRRVNFHNNSARLALLSLSGEVLRGSVLLQLVIGKLGLNLKYSEAYDVLLNTDDDDDDDKDDKYYLHLSRHFTWQALS